MAPTFVVVPDKAYEMWIYFSTEIDHIYKFGKPVKINAKI
jgi:hypothetical protein